MIKFEVPSIIFWELAQDLGLIVKRGNLLVALILEGIGVWVIADSYKMGLQTFNNPGPGFFPFIIGIFLSVLVLPILITSFKNLKKIEIEGKKEEIEEKNENWGNLKKTGIVVLCLFGYFLLLETLGFLTTSFLYLLGLFLIGNPRKWLFFSFVSAMVVGLAYLLFDTFLQIHLPSGFWR